MDSSGTNCCCDPYDRHKEPIRKNLRAVSQADVVKNPSLTVGSFWCDNCRKTKMEVQLQCCNPFSIHGRPIYKSLRVIGENDLKRHSFLTLGSHWCDTCRKVSPVEINQPSGSQSEPNSQEIATSSSQSSGATCSPTLSPCVLKESARRSLGSSSTQPLVTTGHRTKTAALGEAKRKVEEATISVQKKVCLALGLPEDEVVTENDRKAKNYDLLMEKIKAELSSASQTRRYQLLSLATLSMSDREAAEYFNVSKNLIGRVRKLTQEKGILPMHTFSRALRVPESTRLLIVNFYCDDEQSKVLPGKRDCVSVKRGVYEQKRLLLANLPELYEAFKKEYENLQVGFTTFSSLKPKWCISAGQAGTHEQCVCQIHQNFKLIMFALNIKKHYRELIELCVCNVQNRVCMLRACEQCPGFEEIKNILKNEIPRPELESDDSSGNEDFDFFSENVKYRQWKSTDRTEMILQVASRADLIEEAAKQMIGLITHDFISRSQQEYIKKAKEQLTRKKAIIVMDFAMNYNCLIQTAVQSYHWSPKQATVFPVVIYYKDANDQIQQKSIIFISDDLDHDVPLVQVFQEKTMAYIKQNFPEIEEVEWVTDGCSCQFKSKGYFKWLCQQAKKLNIKVTHTHFGTSHGKSQCDANGGTVKRTARRASLQRPLENQIINAQDLFDFCITDMKNNFQFFFVSKSEVDPYRALYLEKMPTLVTLPGTRTFHCFKPLSDDKIACWRVSNDKNDAPALIHSLTKTKAREVELVPVTAGMNVVVRLARNRYVAVVTDVYSEEGEIDVSLLMPKLPANQFHWPKELKSATIPLPHVLCQVILAEEGEKVKFTSDDMNKLYDLRVFKRPH